MTRLTMEQQSEFKARITEWARIGVSIDREYRFAMTPKEQYEKWTEISEATSKLLKAIDSLVPKGLGSLQDFPFNYPFSKQIDATYLSSKLLRKDSHWQAAPDVDSSNDARDWICGRLVQELLRFRDATDEAKKSVKPSRGNAAENTKNGRCKRSIAADLVFQYRSSFGCYPPMTVDGWPTIFLQELFDTHNLGQGANHFLKAEIKKQIDNGISREMLKNSANSRVSKYT